MHARVCSTWWQLLQWEVHMRILTNDICVTVFALFDPVTYDHFKKPNTLARRTSSVLVNCLYLSEPAKLHWGLVLYCCVMCIQLQQCFPSKNFTHVSNFPIANRVTLALNMEQRLQDSERQNKTKMKKFRTCRSKYLQNRYVTIKGTFCVWRTGKCVLLEISGIWNFFSGIMFCLTFSEFTRIALILASYQCKVLSSHLCRTVGISEWF